MQLSRHDLVQLDEAYLAGLPEGSLRALSVKLLADLKEALERLDQNPSNSSRPPSSRAPWEGAGSQRQETPGQDAEESPAGDSRSQRRRRRVRCRGAATEARGAAPPGQRPGAPGHGRTQCLEVHEEHHHHPAVCAVCGAPLGEGHLSARPAPIT